MDEKQLSEKQRSEWMSLLAVSEPEDIKRMADTVPSTVEYTYVLKPETGMIMAQARADGSHSTFNLGEVSVTRCILKVNSEFMGASWIMGSDLHHAKFAALFDGLLQDPDHHDRIKTDVIQRLEKISEVRMKERKQDAKDTTVNFFTMKRGDSIETQRL